MIVKKIIYAVIVTYALFIFFLDVVFGGGFSSASAGIFLLSSWLIFVIECAIKLWHGNLFSIFPYGTLIDRIGSWLIFLFMSLVVVPLFLVYLASLI